jgi:hypothetical protein
MRQLDDGIGDTLVLPGLIQRYRRYHRPIEPPRHVGSNRTIAKEVSVRGFIFDVDTGRLREVEVLERERAA